MKKKSGPKDTDLQGVEKALKRSAENALKLARATKTPCYVMKDGKLIDLVKEKSVKRLKQTKRSTAR